MELSPIGIVHSCFKEKFGTPRQGLLISQAKGTIELFPPYNREEAFHELQGFDYIWLIFSFHLTPDQHDFSPSVRPPRLGGNKKVGVFATRSPFRPNSLGLSLVKLESIENKNGKVQLHISGQDLVQGTPLYDIKPYLPQIDSIPEAKNGWTEGIATGFKKPITYSEQALSFIKSHPKGHEHLMALIEEIAQQDPRPSYYQSHHSDIKKTTFSFLLYDFDVSLNFINQEILVSHIEFSNTTAYT